MSIADVVGSELTLTIVATVLGALWALFKGSDWLEQQQRARLRLALRSIEAAVEATYHEYVRALKEEGGGLSDQQQRQARQIARERAAEIARAQGVDLFKEVGAEYVDLWIGRLVKKLKRAR